MDIKKHQKYLAVSREINKINISSVEDHAKLKVYYFKYLDYNIDARTRKINQKKHSHQFFELLIMVEGENRYEFENQPVVLNAGDFLLVPPKSRHHFVDSSGEFIKIALCFDLEVEDQSGLHARIEALKKLPFIVGKTDSSVMMLMDFIFGGMDVSTEVRGSLIRWSILIMLSLIVDKNVRIEHRMDDSLVKKIKDSDEIFYNAVVEYIQNHLPERGLVAKMAEKLYMSERQIRRRLERYCGKSTSGLIDEIKYEKAKDLILAQVSTDEITEILGFSDYHSFLRFFQRVDGQTPKEFKLAILKDNYT